MLILDENDNHHNKMTRHMSLETLMEGNNQNGIVDLLLIDLEGDDFFLFEYIAQNLDNLPSICQVNAALPAHIYPPRGNSIIKLFFNMINSQQLLLLDARKIGTFYTMYWINVSDPKCRHRFIEN